MVKRKFSIVMAIALALVIMAFAGSAFAQGAPGAVSIETGGRENLGDTVLFEYYDIRSIAEGGAGLSDNYFTVVNTDDDEWHNVHVRVRTGQCSVELLDFDAILSPLDVFTFDLYQGSDGATVFASCDTHTLTASGFNVDSNGCFVLSSATFPDMTSLIERCGNCPDGTAITKADALKATRYGYVEVLSEAELYPDCKLKADCGDCSAEALANGEYTLWTWADCQFNGDCCDTYAADPELFGRVYYARFDAQRNLVGLAVANGISLGNAIEGPAEGAIIHRPCYSDSSFGCSIGDGELENPNPYAAMTGGLNAKYAYNAPYETDDPIQLNGATDMNYCFYKNQNDSETTNGVLNRVGAGATFGPTLADLRNTGGSRNGDYLQTVNAIYSLNSFIDKRGAASHYFIIPGQGQTTFVFTFPFQHFISQRIEVSNFGQIMDTEENSCVPPGGKFISPGLPGVVSPKGEVSIITTQEVSGTCIFNEGWVAFTLNVVRDAVEGGNVGYAPGTLGTVTNSGFGTISEVMSVAPMQWWGGM